MIGYNFKSEFAGEVKSGIKRATLRRAWKEPKRHARVGDPIALWTGQRTKQARRLGIGIVEVRACVKFDQAGIIAFSQLREARTLDAGIERLTTALGNCDGDAFARFDGFENWAAAWAWHDAHRADEEAKTGPIVRQLIAWRLLSPEAEAAIDRGETLEAA